MITYRLTVALRIPYRLPRMPDPYRKELLTARNCIHLGFLLWFLFWFPYRKDPCRKNPYRKELLLAARNYFLPLVVFSFGFLTVRILTVSNFLELLTAALPQGIPYLLAVSRNYNYSWQTPPQSL